MPRHHTRLPGRYKYYKELETLVLKIELEESEKAMIARFVSGLRKDIQDIVELQEYLYRPVSGR